MSGYSDLASILTVRPLTERLPEPSQPSPFSASWTDTIKTLARELGHLSPDRALLEVDIPEHRFRSDGLPRADAIAATPGVVLSLIGSTRGDMRFPAHHFDRWEDNVRALALGFEALRKVDRYGITGRGEQYAGWKALPAGSGPSAARGAELVDRYGSVAKALVATHPDTRTDQHTDAEFADVQAYKGGRS